MSLNVGQLKEIIKNLPDNMEVGDIGHFGELLPVEDWNVYQLTKTKSIFQLEIKDKGEEPD